MISTPALPARPFFNISPPKQIGSLWFAGYHFVSINLQDQ